MTTDGTDPASQLEAVRRAEVLAHTRYPVLGWWYPPSFGALAAVFVAAYALPTWPQIVVMLLCAGVVGTGIRWYTARRGVNPRWRSAPPRIRRELQWFLVGYCALVLAVFAAYAFTTWWVASLVAFAGFTAGIAVYERRYLRAARRDELEAGITRPGVPE